MPRMVITMTAKQFRQFIKTSSECRVSFNLIAGGDAVEIKTTKVALRSAIKGVASDTLVNAEFRENDGVLVMDANSEFAEMTEGEETL